MTRRVRSTQRVSAMCLVCGRDNDAGLHASFYELDGDELLATFTPHPRHQGYPGRLHGGVASALLDEAIGRAINLSDSAAWGVTVELTVRFRKPVPLGEEVRALARITSDAGRLFEGSGEILLADGSVAVEAVGKYLRLPIERIAGDDLDETQWSPDPDEPPATVDI